MTYPITPPRELVQQWIGEIWHEGAPVRVAQSDLHLAARAAQWGADMELEACCKELEYNFMPDSSSLRAARRPKPPTLKEQALARTTAILNDPNRALLIEVRETLELALRALEALPE